MSKKVSDKHASTVSARKVGGTKTKPRRPGALRKRVVAEHEKGEVVVPASVAALRGVRSELARMLLAVDKALAGDRRRDEP